MTKRDFLNAVINGETGAEIVEYAQNALAAMDARNANRKPTKQQLANLALHEPIINLIKARGVVIAKDVAEELDITPQRASAILRQLVLEGHLTSSPTFTPKGVVKAYKITPEATEEEKEDQEG